MLPMPKICSAVHRLADRFLRQCRGSAIPTFAISLVPLVALVGAAVDYSRANNIRSQLQGALDSAVIAGAKDNSASWATAALNMFNATLTKLDSSPGTPTFTLKPDGSFSGSVSASVPMDFLRVLGTSAMNVSAQTTDLLSYLREILQATNYQVLTTVNLADALLLLKATKFNLVLI